MTCFGINNEGQLVLDYYHEDTDQLEGANVYNGQKSVLWCNFRDAFPDKIKETYQDLRSNGVLNYDEMREQFITKGSDKWSESIYNEDADFKYISMLYSDNDASNLGQVRGTGEEHLEYFLENRFNYCDGKWYAPDYADDYVALRIYTPVDENGAPRTDLAVAANADITVTPYSYMYAGLRYKANGTLQQKRVSANEVTTFEAPNETFNDTETAIYGASQLSSLGDLSPLYCGSINVSKATKLTELIIGNDTEGYSNPNLNDLSVGTNNLLKVVNVRNCPKLTDPLALAGCPNIEEIYAAGSAITGIDLANSGYLKVIELPATIANLTLKNQLYVESLTLEGYSAIKTINIENCPTVRSLDILGAATNVERVRLTNVNWTYDTAAEVLALADRNLAGIDENGANIDKMWIDGKCHIKTLTGADYLKVKEAFPYMNITYDTLTAQLIFMSEDGNTELTRQTIQNGGNGTDPVTAGTIERPTKESTAQYHFTYSGWSLTPGGVANVNALKNVEADRIVYVSFAKELRSYTVKFYNGTTLLQTSTVQYGGDAVYAGSTPVNNSTGNPDDFEFYGWKPSPTNIQGTTDCYAQFYDLREITDDWATIAANVANGTATEKYAIGAFKTLNIGEKELPYEFNQGSAVVYDGEIHILGSVISEYRTSHYKWDGTEWVEVGVIPYEFYYGSAVVYNNEIHILGGSSSSSGRTKHYKWDGSNWTFVSTLPYVFEKGVAIVYDNEIHIMGSYNSSNYTSHYKWNGSAWSEVGNLPYSFYTASGFIYNNEIHVLGSYDSNYETAHYKWNGSTWTSVSTLPQKLSNGHVLVVGTDIYMIQWDEFYKYDGVSWHACPEVPANVYDGRSVVLDDNIYVMGSSVSKNSRVFYSYAPETSTWSKVGITETIPMEIIAHNHDELADGERKWESVSFYSPSFNAIGFCVYNDAIHIINSNNNHYKWNGSEWIEASTPPITFNYPTAIAYNDKLHVFSGTTHYTWDETNGWVEVGTLPYTVKFGSAVVYNNHIHLFDGRVASKRHMVYDGSGWTSYNNTPCLVCNQSAVVYDNTIHIIAYKSTSHYKWNGSEWVEVSTLPVKHKGSVMVYDDCLYIHNEYSSYKWDGTEWSEAGKIPYNIGEMPAIVYRNEIYRLGFYNAAEVASARNLLWKWAGPSFERIGALPVGKKDYGRAVYNNAIHYMLNNAHYKYQNGEWSEASTLPTTFSHHPTIVAYNDKLHVFCNTTHYTWDETNGWVEVGIIPKAINAGGGSSIVYNNCIHLLSMLNGRFHMVYDGATWTTLNETMPGSIQNESLAVYDGKLHAIVNNTYNHYTWDETDGWSNAMTIPFKYSSGGIAVYEDCLYALANDEYGGFYKFDGNKWSLICCTGYRSLGGSLVVYNDRIHRLGAQSSCDETVKNAYNFHFVLKNPRATLTFLAKNLLKDKVQYNTTAIHGWDISYLRKWMNETFVTYIPEDLQNGIKPVIKISDSGGLIENATLINTIDRIWTPSIEELGGTHNGILGQGEPYSVFTNAKSRIRLPLDGDTTTRYAVRTSEYDYHATAFVHECILTTGNFSYGSAVMDRNPLIGFCI